MPITPPVLDDRRFDDLVNEIIARIPAHTPEWTNPMLGDPGRTMVDLFAWLVDTLLYRVNLIPERQRLAFLRLLDVPMKPARAAGCLVNVSFDDEDQSDAVTIKSQARIDKPIPFETLSELTILPVTAVSGIRKIIIIFKAVWTTSSMFRDTGSVPRRWKALWSCIRT